MDFNNIEMVDRHSKHNVDDDNQLEHGEQMIIPQPLSVRMRRKKIFWFVVTIMILIPTTIIMLSRFYNNDEKQNLIIQNQSYSEEDNNVSSVIEQGKDNSETNIIDPTIFDADTILKNDDNATENNNPVENEVVDEVQLWLSATVTLQDGPMFEIIEQIEHDKNSFTEGLTYANDILYESIGLNGQSSLLILDALTGKTIESYDIDRKYFGEGLTYMNGKLVQLTWKAKTGFIYDANDLSIAPTTFQFTTTTNEGWGITYDSVHDELIVSDGSKYLHFWEPNTMQEKRKIEVVRQNGKKSTYINELELWRGRVLANIWYEDTIIVINPETGLVEKEYGKSPIYVIHFSWINEINYLNRCYTFADFNTLWDYDDRLGSGADVLNGISVSEDPNILYVTGKNWNRMFRLRLLTN